MQMSSAESSYREAIEIHHEAVKKADIDEVIDILKRMNNEEVSSYREAIEILHEAVKKANIDEIIYILKRYNNEEVIRVALCKPVIADDISLVQAILHHIKIANVSDNFFEARKYHYDVNSPCGKFATM